MENNYQEVLDLFTNHERMKCEFGFIFIDRSLEVNIDISRHLKFVNTGKFLYNQHYSPFPEPQGKVEIYTDLRYGAIMGNPAVFIEIRQDGGTRKVFHGIIQSVEFFKQLLYSIR